MKALCTASVLLALGGRAAAIDISNEYRYACRAGNCSNGQGTVWDAGLGILLQGTWADGKSIPGQPYTATVPRVPKRSFTQVFGKDGLLAQGDQPRGISFGAVLPYFSGSFGRVEHPFVRLRMPVPRDGVYHTGTGIEYRGRFEYLPSKSGTALNNASGVHIFFGEKVDTEENESETGLFISGDTLSGTPIMFMRAEPAYLALLQKRYQRDMAIAQEEFREQESARKWSAVLGVLTQVALTLAGGGGGGGGRGGGSLGGEIAMNLVGSMFNTSNEKSDVGELAGQAVSAAAADNRALASALSKAVSDGIAGGAQ